MKSGTLARIVLVIVAVLLVNQVPPSFAQSDFDSYDMGFGMPDITVKPLAGPPGSKVEIMVTNMPSPPKGQDPRIEFFVYLPFVTALGSNVANNCAGEVCFPLYSFEEINEDKVAAKTITFTLFSTQNPKPTLQSGQWESVCDLKVNGKTIARYGTVCNEKDQPLGEYEIKFAWGIQRSDLYDIRKTITFTVTEAPEKPEQEFQNPDDIVFEQYKNGEITEEEFEKKLSEFGYDAEEIRQAKALLGKLPHQQGSYSPEQKATIEEGIKKAEEQRKAEREAAESADERERFIGDDLHEPQGSEEAQTVSDSQEESKLDQKSGCLIATATFGTEFAPQVQLLRELRDNTILQTESGLSFMTAFNSIYYMFSPTIADWERQNSLFKEAVKVTLMPMLSTLSVLNYVEIDSETEMLEYGIGIILLNASIYFGIPALVIIKTRKYLSLATKQYSR
ncbi:MAG TPA: CFI-box-CTERM domain-containing protein [Candidatus Nitrosotenuis sp.]|nr:CFI-box-CTERM domain-containing protein [Candidatus Nitrosotenuis sp.]